MPKRKSRFTNKKTRSKSRSELKYVGGDPSAPTEEEWKTFTSYGSFVIEDEDNQSHSFKVLDIARIVPEHIDADDDIEFHQFWVAQIKEIRARGKDDVWARVQWYYSGQDIADRRKTFDASRCGKYERFRSDQLDFVEIHCFDGLTTVSSFDEANVDQLPIPRSTYFGRYSFDHLTGAIHKYIPKPETERSKPRSAKMVMFAEGEANSSAGPSGATTGNKKRKRGEPEPEPVDAPPPSRSLQLKTTTSIPTQPGLIATCTCRKPYNPDKDTMHFCASCLKSFHTPCLTSVWIDKTPIEEREMRLIASLPAGAYDDEKVGDMDTYLELLANKPTSTTPPFTITVPPAKRTRGRPKVTKPLKGTKVGRPRKSKTHPTTPPTIWIPEELRFLATQQIVRGVDAGGVAGNVCIVVRARRMMHAAFTGEEKVPIGWRNVLEDEGVIGSVEAAEHLGHQGLQRENFLCPSCGGPI